MEEWRIGDIVEFVVSDEERTRARLMARNAQGAWFGRTLGRSPHYTVTIGPRDKNWELVQRVQKD